MSMLWPPDMQACAKIEMQIHEVIVCRCYGVRGHRDTFSAWYANHAHGLMTACYADENLLERLSELLVFAAFV